MSNINSLTYFGTELNMSGHYFWELQGSVIRQSKIGFRDIPFDPENLIKNVQNGKVKYLIFGEYKVCAIEGSCYDKRPGSHSIFWTKEPIKLGEFKEIIFSIPAARQIIEQMPFEVIWNTIL